MLQSTRGFIFNVTRYSDSSAIVKIFTENEGLQSFIVRSLFSRTSRLRPALFGHLSLLDLLIDYKAGRALQYIREATLNKHFYEVQNSVIRSSILLFINEILLKSVKEEEANQTLFEFIDETVTNLNNTDIPVAAFHILFLIRLSDLLGFGTVHSLAMEGGHLDLLSGETGVHEPAHPYHISHKPLELLKEISLMEFADLKNLQSDRTSRIELTNKLVDFYKIHIPDMPEIKSLKVLHEVQG